MSPQTLKATGDVDVREWHCVQLPRCKITTKNCTHSDRMHHTRYIYHKSTTLTAKGFKIAHRFSAGPTVSVLRTSLFLRHDAGAGPNLGPLHKDTHFQK